MAKKKFQAEEATSRLQECLNVAVSLGDNITAGLSGLLLFNPSNSSLPALIQIEQRLKSEGLDLGLILLLKKLLVLAKDLPESLDEFAQFAARSIEQALRFGRRDELEHICIILSRALEGIIWPFGLTHELRPIERVFRSAIDPRLAAEVAVRDARSGRILWDLGKRLFDYDWQDEFSARLMDSLSHRIGRLETTERDYRSEIEWLRLIRDASGAYSFSDFFDHRRFSPNFLDRLFSPRHLLEMSENNPERALAYIQVAHELGGDQSLGRYTKKVAPEIVRGLLDSGRLLEFSGINPDGALAYIRMFKEVGGGRTLSGTV